MARLSLRLDASGLDLAMGATAFVEQLAGAHGLPANAPFQRSLPVSAGPAAGSSCDVPPGRYQVSAILPSGEVLRQQIAIADADVTVTLHAAPAPDDSLGLQRLGGTVASRQSHEARLAQMQLRDRGYLRGIVDGIAGPQTRDALRRFQAATGLEASGELSPETLAALAAGTPTDQAASARDGRRRRGRGRDAATDQVTFGIPSDPAGEDAWRRWRAFAQSDSSAKLFPNSLYDHTASFTQRFRDPLTIVWRAHVPDRKLVRRRWGIVRTPQETTIVSLPLPWITKDDGPAVDADVTVDLGPSAGRSRVSVAVPDRDLGALLLYLGSGRLSGALTLLESLNNGGNFLQRLIDGEGANPLAACAAGYIAVATWSESGTPPWEPWLARLREAFVLIPDGAIIEATWRLQNLGQSDPALALAALKAGFARGIPFFTGGLRCLQDGLSLFAGNDAQAQRMFSLVQKVARRADPLQAFTTLRLPVRRRA